MEAIRTPWGEQLDADRIHPEYPRPQMVRDSYLNLNGRWEYAISRSAAFPAQYDGEIVVPFSPECPLSGVNRVVGPDAYLEDRRRFTLPEGFHRGRVFLHFGAVDQTARVYVNGTDCGGHKGGYLPFTMDVTRALRPGENELRLQVRDATDRNDYARGKQKFKRGGIWYSPQSGIWQTVWMESTPENFIRDFKITPDYDAGEVRFDIRQGGTPSECTVQVFDADALAAEGSGRDTVTLKLEAFKSWSPEEPFLYTAKVSNASETLDTYFGMRKFSVGTDSQGMPRLFLNNRPYFHNGLLDQGYYCDGYLTPPSDQAMENDIQTMKDMGFNMLRKHIKVEPLRWYYHCDRLGMLVWQDMVNGGGKYGLEINVWPFIGVKMDDGKYKNFGRANHSGREMFLKEAKQTVELLYNVPSIAMWVPFNEGWGQFDAAKVHGMVRALDPTRHIDHASGWHDQGAGDFISEHIYFTPIRIKADRIKKDGRPYILSEFGGLGLKLPGHTFNNKMFGYKIYKSKETLQAAFEKLYNNVLIPQIGQGLSAAVYTQVTDVEDELNGILTYDRKVNKLDTDRVKEINAKMRL
ncbi:MAG: glycoside hydrolase family 2 [Clostridiales bacterium]|nr:glycoside hydrolase family 2 [Clostridiales bacterium]